MVGCYRLHVGLMLGVLAWGMGSAAIAQVSLPSADGSSSLSELDGNESQRSLAQVTAVTELSDVQPTDWAYEALQLLVTRYNCIAGYPNQTFRGDRPISRYEFAASLSACLENITVNSDDQEALLSIERLQREFVSELATVRDRVAELEGRIPTLEENQFSTTTKLYGEAIFGLSAPLGNSIDGSDEIVLQNRVRLNLRASFSGEDALNIRLTSGNFLPPVVPGSLFPVVTAGTGEGRLSSGVGGNTGNSVEVDRLDYSFPVGDRVNLYVAGIGGRSSYYVPSTVNPYFDDFDGGSGAISSFAQQNPIYRIGGGAGAGVSFSLDASDRIVLSAGYLASRSNESGESRGLFNGDFAALAQATVTPSSALQIGLTYVRGYHTSDSYIFSLGEFDEFYAGTVVANALHQGLGVAATTNSFGGSLSYRVSPGLTLNAFGGYTDLNFVNDVGSGEIWYYGLGVALPDLFKDGNLGGVLVGVEPYLGGATVNGLNLPRLGLSNDTSLHVEAFYRYAFNDNISLTPGIVWITAPDQFEGNDDIVIGTLRLTFAF
ncbi:iron uptake porin [Leptolyngbya sp. AN02str]|uniref:iron uptake porin n=1 Tax=Leptolyngbya sp. AN02str TaxID=3423363 RepID=UPI003D310BE4